ncbi:hypothetical protein BGW80DRAFT_1436931 [Lactifluus volemus]|nr:hypothetical protein BGW80DRAFT_1436931 [Lactifluus volemus]
MHSPAVSPSVVGRNLPSVVAYRAPSSADFEIERAPSPRGHTRPPMRRAVSDYSSEAALKESIGNVIAAKARPYATCGRIPVDPATLSLFFRTKSGITHSLDFPIDVDYDTPPAWTRTYLQAVRDKLEIVPTRARMAAQGIPGDMRVATVILTLPVRFRGGALFVTSPEGGVERFQGRSGKSGQIDWVAYLSDCSTEVEPVQKGCHFGPAGVSPDPLITPSDYILDNLAQVFNVMRGHVLAESLVPYLKGGDSILYHAVKLYKLSPELRWTAGGYIWPVDAVVEYGPEVTDSTTGGYGEEETIHLQYRIEQAAGIVLLADKEMSGSVSKERVPLVSRGLLDKLVVNILLVIYVS